MPIYVERALIFLVISCPCALVLSIPLSFFSGIGAQSKQGVLVKSGSDIETLAELKNVVFDKTGTLTKGTFEIVDIVSKDNDLLIKYAAHAESFSTHPIAKSIVSSYPYPINQSLVTEVSEVFGQGVSCLFENHKLLVGSAKLMEQNHIALPVIQQGKTIVYVAYDNQLTGYLTISDVLKENSKKTIEELRKQMIDVSVVTGDHMQSAEHMLNGLHIKTYANCLPEDKVSIVESYIQKGKTAFIGDGVNDAPVLISANLGVAMGGLGSDAAIEAADAVIMNDDPYKIIDAIRISKKTMRIVKQNIVFAISIKVIVLILGALGLANMWLAIFADVGVSLLAVFNSLRIFRSNK
jgi:Cd2+/Zn2+-exporting ATPase